MKTQKNTLKTDQNVALKEVLLILVPVKSNVIEQLLPTGLYLAGPEDLEHERQAMCDELLSVLLFLDAAELFQESLDQRSAVLMETCTQRLQPGV